MKTKNLIYGMTLCFLVGALGTVWAAPTEITTTLDDQTHLSVTIYNSNLALVKETRSIRLPKGESNLAFREVSAQMRPETALLKGDNLSVVEQNFEFDLLTPSALLQKYVGQDVSVVRVHPTTGEETIEQAHVLSANDGVVLQMGDHIETGVPGRLIFPDVPENLRDRPTLVLMVNSHRNGVQDVELSYLTSGLGWKADYVAELNARDDHLDINGWVTLTNRSGTTFPAAKLQLVAGDVNRVAPQPQRNVKYMMDVEASPVAGGMEEESMFEYHLYTLGHPTTIKDNQTKQVALLQGQDIPCRKEFVLNGQSYYYRNAGRDLGDKLKVGVFVEIENSKQNHLGLPIPKGVVRVYKEDSHGSLQFIGEDRIDHTPENETMRLKLGDAFDVTANRKQTDFKKLRGNSQESYEYESSYLIELKNAKDEAVVVKVVEPVPGDWKIIKESHKHTKPTSHTAVWQVRVPAKGSASLEYRVRTKY